MTDIGKIVLNGGTIISQKENKLLLKSSYKLEDRLKWNPDWKLPESAEVDKNGRMLVWYLDGNR
jgi:lysine 2,3-aminomutase